MLELLKTESNMTYTENGALANSTSGSFCLDLFFRAGGMRSASERDISEAVIRAYCENSEKTMKIIFFARDVRGGLGERRFFRIAVKTLSDIAPEAVERNIEYFSEYGRYDDLCALLGTRCEKAAFSVIKKRLFSDIKAMSRGEKVSLLAKWLPSVNASSAETVKAGRKLAKMLGMSEREYRTTLSAIRKYSDILENRLRVSDYTFSYDVQPSCAMLKYRKAFIRNDGERYMDYLRDVRDGKERLNTAALYPYEIVRSCLCGASREERLSLDTVWNNLSGYGENSGNCLAVIDGSGSMTLGSGVRPIDAALSLGIYLAEHNKGAFAGNFITFSENPRLVEIKGRDIYEKVNFCRTFNEVANTNLEAVFNLILRTAVANKLSQFHLPERLFVISDMEFDECVMGGNSLTLFTAMKEKYRQFGYELPEVVFWNVASRRSNLPVTMSETGAALVSGFSPAVFDMVIKSEISPVRVMDDILSSERYRKVG